MEERARWHVLVGLSQPRGKLLLSRRGARERSDA